MKTSQEYERFDFSSKHRTTANKCYSSFFRFDSVRIGRASFLVKPTFDPRSATMKIYKDIFSGKNQLHSLLSDFVSMETWPTD